MDAAGVDCSVIMPMDFGVACGEAGLTIEEKNERVAAICRRHPGRLFACVGVDPRRPGAAGLVRRGIIDWGAVGVKLYPPTGFYPWDDVCEPVYAAAAEHGVPVAFHTGAVAYPLKSKFGRPLHIDEVAKKHPELRIIMLHTGFHRSWTDEAVQVAIYNPNVHCEMAGWQEWGMGEEELAAFLAYLFERIGSDRILFGTDWTGRRKRISEAAWLATVRAAFEVPAAGLGDAASDAVLGGNAARLFRIPARGPAAP
jgi:predicted TIM-barrel fold metal-dependent hydrolase